MCRVPHLPCDLCNQHCNVGQLQTMAHLNFFSVVVDWHQLFCKFVVVVESHWPDPLSWQAVPGSAIFCNLLSGGQNQFMVLQPIIFTSVRRDWRESAFRSSANRGLATPPSLTTQPMQIQLKHAIESLLIVKN